VFIRRIAVLGVLTGFLVATAPQMATSATLDARSHARFSECSKGYYKNSSGSCVHSPIKIKTKGSTWPAGTTAKCFDGTYSFSLHHSGTCSHHGGVAIWR
jgi:hypothetical protein